MLEFYFGTHAPTFSEIIAEINNSMGNVETSVRRIVLIFRRIIVTKDVIAIKVSCIGSLSVTANAETVSLHMILHTVGGGIVLRSHTCWQTLYECRTKGYS